MGSLSEGRAFIVNKSLFLYLGAEWQPKGNANCTMLMRSHFTVYVSLHWTAVGQWWRMQTLVSVTSYRAWMRVGPYVYRCECLVPSWWNCLTRIRRRDLVGGGVPSEMGFSVSKAPPCPASFSLQMRCRLPAPAAVPGLPVAMLPHSNHHGLNLWNCTMPPATCCLLYAALVRTALYNNRTIAKACPLSFLTVLTFLVRN